MKIVVALPVSVLKRKLVTVTRYFSNSLLSSAHHWFLAMVSDRDGSEMAGLASTHLPGLGLVLSGLDYNSANFWQCGHIEQQSNAAISSAQLRLRLFC